MEGGKWGLFGVGLLVFLEVWRDADFFGVLQVWEFYVSEGEGREGTGKFCGFYFESRGLGIRLKLTLYDLP